MIMAETLNCHFGTLVVPDEGPELKSFKNHLANILKFNNYLVKSKMLVKEIRATVPLMFRIPAPARYEPASSHHREKNDRIIERMQFHGVAII